MRFRPGLSFCLLLAGLLLVPAAYFGENAGAGAASRAARDPAAGPAPSPLGKTGGGQGDVGAKAPAFVLEALAGGGKTALEDLPGKVVLLDFWATWCAPCKRTLPGLARLGARHPGLAVLAVSLDEDRAKARAFLEKVGRGDTALVGLFDEGRKVAERYDLAGMPAAVLIDRGGVVRARYDGYTEGDLGRMEAEIRKLLGERP